MQQIEYKNQLIFWEMFALQLVNSIISTLVNINFNFVLPSCRTAVKRFFNFAYRGQRFHSYFVLKLVVGVVQNGKLVTQFENRYRLMN